MRSVFVDMSISSVFPTQYKLFQVSSQPEMPTPDRFIAKLMPKVSRGWELLSISSQNYLLRPVFLHMLADSPSLLSILPEVLRILSF